MVAAVEVDAGQEAKRGKATDEEGQLTPPPPQLLEVARPHRQPTPDHPPYCWVIPYSPRIVDRLLTPIAVSSCAPLLISLL
jgi:hypothetical protein